MEYLILLISFAILFVGVFVFQKLWLGSLLAIVCLVVLKVGWFNEFDAVLYALANTSIIWTELIFLLFGAYLFYHVLSSRNHFVPFTNGITTVSSKISIVLMLCWFLGSFMEGIAGFGIPTLIIAPLLLAIGFKPLSAVLLPLASNTTAVLFGALGTPFKIGLSIDEVNEEVYYVLALNILPALAMPFLLAFLFSQIESQAVDWKKDWKLLLGAGLCFYVPFVITGFFSIEFPSIIGGFVGLLLFVGFFVPTEERPLLGVWWRTFYPYLFFIALLMSCKYLYGEKRFYFSSELKSFSYYQPGIVFMVSAVLVLFWYQQKKAFVQLLPLIKSSFIRIRLAAVTVFLLVLFTQLITTVFSKSVSALLAFVYEPLQVIIKPLLGVVGSFLTGTATMSNLLYEDSLKDLSIENKALLVALLHTGSALGNVVSLQNIIMAKSIVPGTITEAKALRLNSIVVVVYLFLAISTAFLFYR